MDDNITAIDNFDSEIVLDSDEITFSDTFNDVDGASDTSETSAYLADVPVEADSHDFLTTSFSEYTVTEGLLLSILLCIIGQWAIKWIRGAFTWLR